MIYCIVWNLRELIIYTNIKWYIRKIHNWMAKKGNIWRLYTSIFLVVNKVLQYLTEAVLALPACLYLTASMYSGILSYTMIHRNRFLLMAFSYLERHALKIMLQRTILTTSWITHTWVHQDNSSRNRVVAMKEMGICNLDHYGVL